jgi:hypothetical protein
LEVSEINSEEKLKRLLQDEWEIHGDTKQLCMILRDEIHKRRMTEAEREALNHLVDFWNAYIALPPSVADPVCRDVQNAVHAIQGAMALRVAGRCDPDFWRHD